MIKRKILILLTGLLLWPAILFSQTAILDSIKVTPLDPKVNVSTLYRLSFVVTDTIPTDAQFALNFPDGFDLSQVTLAGSKTMNGGFKVTVAGQEVVIRRQGEGATIYPDKKVNLLFSTVKNPDTSNANYLLQIRILDGRGNSLTNVQTSSFAITP